MNHFWLGFVIFFCVYFAFSVFYLSFRLIVWLIFDKKISDKIEKLDNKMNELSNVPFIFVWELFKKSQENLLCRFLVFPIFLILIFVMAVMVLLSAVMLFIYMSFCYVFVSYLLLINFKNYVLIGNTKTKTGGTYPKNS